MDQVTTPYKRSIAFINSLKSCPASRLPEEIFANDFAWLDCWDSVEDLPLESVRILLSIMSLVQDMEFIAPPPLGACTKAVKMLVEDIRKKKTSLKDVLPLVKDIEGLVNVSSNLYIK